MTALTAYIDALVDQLIHSGVRHVVFSPGSRSTPLAVGFARRTEIRMHPQLDERSAGFLALGIAKATRIPAALVCTSGTAAANYLPAVVEARYGRVPLVVLTADRPHEARDLGSPQTIDQIKMYGSFVKWFAEMAPADACEDLIAYVRTAAARAAALACGAPPGPVHLNFPFREPLVPNEGIPSRGAGVAPGKTVCVSVRQPPATYEPQELALLADELAGKPRGLIVCGPQDDPGLASPLAALADRLGYPILADPLSQVRMGPHDRTHVVDAYDWMLRSPAFRKAAVPEVILRFGAVPTSKALNEFMRSLDCRHVAIDPGDWNDPMLRATVVYRAESKSLCQALARACASIGARERRWRSLWTELGRKVRETVQSKIETSDDMFEGRAARELVDLMPEGAALLVGNSMPVRDLDAFAGASPKALRLFANRGANGIDGVVSTACGLATTGTRTALLIGDVSFFHDLNGLVVNRLTGVDLTIVLLNNDGGGIFSFLPQAERVQEFERLFATPHGLDFKPAVKMYGGRYARVHDWGAYRSRVAEALQRPGLDVVEVRTERRENAERHRALWAEISATVDALVAGFEVRSQGGEGGAHPRTS